MKKILSLLTIGLLITCMIGTAMAGSGTTVVTDNENLIQTENSEDTIVVPTGSTTEITLDLSSVTSSATVTISLAGSTDSDFTVTIPKEGIFSKASSDELILYPGESISKSMGSRDQKTYTLTVADKGATDEATLTVTVVEDGNRCTCS